MDGVSWSTTRAQESFSRSKTASDTLSRLASFIARADPKQHTQNQRQQPSHMATYVCKECGKGFPYATDMLHHQELKHTLPKPHRCPSCGQEFSLKSSLQLHKCNHDSSPCELCPAESQPGSPCPSCTASDPGRLQDASLHRQPRLPDGSAYSCAPCGRGFSQKQALLHHQQAGCNEPPSPSDIVDASSLPDNSPISKGGLNRSDSSVTPGPSSGAVSVCLVCSTTFRTEVGLQRHKQTYHAEQGHKTKGGGTGGEARKGGNSKVNGDLIKMPKSKTKLLDCRSCDMVFRSTSKLYMHRKEKHSREKNVMTEPRPITIKRRKVHSYPCQICRKVFLHHLSLRAHYRQHTASSSTTIQNKSQPVGSTTKDSEFLENGSNKVKPSLAEDKPVKAGPGRPRKVAKVEDKVTDPGRCREVPEVEEEEEDELEREFPCPSCAEVFSLQSRLREHVELHQSSVRRRQCSVCTSEMDTCKWPGSKRQRLYHCVPCQQGFAALDSFLEHCQEHLRVRVEEDSITEGYAHQASKA
ncbi:zinc finger protein 271 [Anoplopoma fimbria]|uniref:zinc finger protein 271 n=1 Tax=Anoplopoma fimbria TaxID=229290 RepID=UPI0023EB96A3|nr:zinc finger protein 271 [Anoplopoma fimbria]XP_054465467.1 zinc finger protein 271 [Anoplopoma fimbria]XP_054465468.1 zinc finger protein 271 [Anoplopoma fimbria]XP_054465469.1 zinc finger protein 271 [Anoplopoma fimbria]XP_054465470.1 zinc finger protein 271 [Anoplopoma fimbria]XP_054465471.1 zinc finger protein 271 [Anoplopoma fimbria]XP_054465472.1 zinc finger protein 271 [Anoplopoma fimbria]